MEQLIYRITLVLTSLVNLGMAAILLRHIGRYAKYPNYRTARLLTVHWLVAFAIGYLFHAIFNLRHTWPTAASALTATYFHIGALCFTWGYTSLLDASFLTRKVVVRDIAIFILGLTGYWTVALCWKDAPDLTLLSFSVFFVYGVYGIVVFYGTYNRVSYRMLKMSQGSVGNFVRWMQVCCDLIILFGIGSVAMTGIFPNEMWPYIVLLLMGVGMFGFMVYSIEKYGSVIDDATKATNSAAAWKPESQRLSVTAKMPMILLAVLSFSFMFSLTSCNEPHLTSSQEMEADSLVSVATTTQDYEKALTLIGNIVNGHILAGRYQEANEWSNLFDNMLQRYRAQPDAISGFVDGKWAQLNFYRSCAMDGMEQRTTLLHQRFVSSAVTLAMVIFGFGLLVYFRHQAAMRLETAYYELELANARAEESSRIKSEFIHQISHEIRTPLNILTGFTQVITAPDMDLDEQTRNDINRQIMENTERLTGLVNKMLELSDARSQTVIDRTDNIPAMLIATEAVDASGINTACHLSFNLEVAPQVETLMLHTNRHAAVRALSLVLDNARKFTAPVEGHSDACPTGSVGGKPQAVLHLSTDGDQVLFVVEDTGIGIPADEAERIFEEFVQLDDYYPGTGIGLTVAQSLARRLGGDIALDTSYTVGARFVMNLPLC